MVKKKERYRVKDRKEEQERWEITHTLRLSDWDCLKGFHLNRKCEFYYEVLIDALNLD